MDDELMNTEVEETSSVENSDVAETEDETNSTAEVQETDAPEQIDVNAIAAAARRKAEADARAEWNRRDAEFAKRFGHLTNPITGQPIRSEADYLSALDAQEDLRKRQEMQSKGIDPQMLDDYIANNPTVKQAQMVMQEAQNAQTYAQINSDVAELGKLDPSITSLLTTPPEVIEMSMRMKISLTDSYKILNYGKVNSSQQAALTQSAINQAKGKTHLNPVNGVSTPDEGVEIPSSELSMWKDTFPDKTAQELKALYNKSL